MEKEKKTNRKIIEKKEMETNKNNLEKGKGKPIQIIEKSKKETNRNKLRKRKPIEIIVRQNKRNYFFLFPIISYKMSNISNFFENEKQGTLLNTSIFFKKIKTETGNVERECYQTDPNLL